MAVIILSLITIIILLFLLSMLWPPDSPWSPWWRTTTRLARIECKLAKVKKGDVIYDLGCGDGTALIIAAKEFGATGVGIEIDLLRVWVSRIKIVFNGLSDRLAIQRKSFWDQNISEATVIFLYLIPKTLIKLRPKLLKELRPGTRVVTFVYQIDLPLIAHDEKNEIYCYEIPKRKK